MRYERIQLEVLRSSPITREIYFDGGWSEKLNLSEGIVLIGCLARHWSQVGPSSAPEAELKTAVLAAEEALRMAEQKQFDHCIIFGDNEQAVGLRETRADYLKPLAARRDEVSARIPSRDWRYIPSKINPAGKVIKQIQRARSRGEPMPSRVEIWVGGQFLGIKVISSSRTPLSTVGRT